MTSFESAALYHSHHSSHPEDLAFWLDLASKFPGPILELGCGSGRVLLPLTRAGHQVTGLDLDLNMLAVLSAAWHTNPPAGPAAGPDPCPPVFQADFTRYHLDRPFRLILLPCNTYSTLNAPARLAVLGAARAHLQPEGAFAISLPNPDLLLNLPARSAPEMEEVFPHPLDGEPVQVSSAWRRTRRQFILFWHYDHLLPDGSVQRTTLETRHALEDVDTYLEEIRTAGFYPLEIWGDYDRSDLIAESPQLIFVLKIK